MFIRDRVHALLAGIYFFGGLSVVNSDLRQGAGLSGGVGHPTALGSVPVHSLFG